MAVDERARNALYNSLKEVLGMDNADTAMALLPPVDWAEVATKDDVRMAREDLRAVEDRLRLMIEAAEHRIMSGMRREMTRLVVAMATATLGAIAVLTVGLVVPLVTLT